MPHIHEKIDFTVEVFIVYKNKVLLRKHDKYKLWMSVGGHIELDEDPIVAAIREVKEEVGLDIVLYNKNDLTKLNDSVSTELIPPIFINRHYLNQDQKHEHVTLVYFSKASNDNLVFPDNKEKSEECKWFTIEEIDNPEFGINNRVKEYAKTALQTLGE